MRTTLAILLVVGMLAVPSAAASHDTDCETYRTSSVPIVNLAFDVAEVQLCDGDGDGVSDTAAFETDHVHNEGEVSATDERKQRSTHQDRVTESEVYLDPGTPTNTIVDQNVEARDDGNDGEFEEVRTAGEVYTGAGRVSYIVVTEEEDGDPFPETIGFAVCPAVTCVAPPSELPEVPDRIDLPDTVVHVPFVGYVP